MTTEPHQFRLTERAVSGRSVSYPPCALIHLVGTPKIALGVAVFPLVRAFSFIPVASPSNLRGYSFPAKSQLRGAFSKKASRSAHLNLHRPPMILPSISPLLTYSRTVRGFNFSTSAASRSVRKRSPIGLAPVFFSCVMVVFTFNRIQYHCLSYCGSSWALNCRASALHRLAPLSCPQTFGEASHRHRRTPLELTRLCC